MLSTEQLEQMVKAYGKINEVIGEYIEMKTRLIELREERVLIVASGDSDLLNANLSLEEQIIGLMEADEYLIKLKVQLIECILS